MVLQHLPLAAEMVPAGPTDVGLALLMGPPVPGEVDLLSEVLPTHGGGGRSPPLCEFFGGSPAQTLLLEHLPAGTAAEEFLPCWCGFSHKVPGGILPSPLDAVDLLVLDECDLLVEATATQPALEGRSPVWIQWWATSCDLSIKLFWQLLRGRAPHLCDSGGAR